MAKDKQKRSALNEEVTRKYTVHLHKYVHGATFKKHTPKAVKAIRAFAEKAMGTKDIRIDPQFNRALWARGVKHVPHRIRVRLARHRNDDENTKEKLYTFVSHVPVASFKGLETVTVDEA
ncbi:60S ribosomal protein L31B [Spiromyces aspiralis]|uniref:60S ribosomal protein L31B n=1 Tax=Spiromyces aspiralis TaxID=68401 RepID=A0ACC1HG02_9FUNG|nr:60S ribosomal protein L31B [Spiromyces aspiralis]